MFTRGKLLLIGAVAAATNLLFQGLTGERWVGYVGAAVVIAVMTIVMGTMADKEIFRLQAELKEERGKRRQLEADLKAAEQQSRGMAGLHRGLLDRGC